jgi:zinc finger SWIM domain-containing protein 3
MDNESMDDYYDIIKNMVASEDDRFDFYNNYALEKGFSVRKSYVEWDFGDVVISDNTYMTNKHNLPFVPFVGLNHHVNIVIFGCGIIAHETGDA